MNTTSSDSWNGEGDAHDQRIRKAIRPDSAGNQTEMITPADILAIRRALDHLSNRFGRGTWRIRDDAIDAAYDKTVDRWLFGPDAPSDRLTAYVVTVFRNSVRSGPARRLLDRRSVTAHPNLRLAIEGRASPTDADDVECLPLHLLTPAELSALASFLEHLDIARAADAAGMTRRDLCVRVLRAAKKFQAHRTRISSHYPS